MKGSSAGTRRDCTHDGTHLHGTEAAYRADRCRCLACRCQMARIARERYKAKAYGRFQPELLPVTGARRRLQALAAIGWSNAAVAAHTGLSIRKMQGIRSNTSRQTQLHRATFDRIRAAYDALWDKTPPALPGRASSAPARARCAAARKGWVPPLAWDDDEIDNPTARPHLPGPGQRELALCGTEAAYRRHQRRGEQPCAACRAAESRRAAERKAA